MNTLIGFCSGIISGMGIGGGAVLIPALVLICGTDPKVAQGINLVYFLPTAVFSLIIHIKNKNVEIKTAVIIGIFGIIGAVGGAFIALNLESSLLRKMFGIFLALIGAYEIFKGIKAFVQNA